MVIRREFIFTSFHQVPSVPIGPDPLSDVKIDYNKEQNR